MYENLEEVVFDPVFRCFVCPRMQLGCCSSESWGHCHQEPRNRRREWSVASGGDRTPFGSKHRQHSRGALSARSGRLSERQFSACEIPNGLLSRPAPVHENQSSPARVLFTRHTKYAALSFFTTLKVPEDFSQRKGILRSPFAGIIRTTNPTWSCLESGQALE